MRTRLTITSREQFYQMKWLSVDEILNNSKTVERKECLSGGQHGNKELCHQKSILLSFQHSIQEYGIVDQ